MKKLLFLFFSLSVSVCMNATYRGMEFKTSDGEIFTRNVDNLVMVAVDGNLTITNASEDALSIPLTALVSMEFIDYTDSLDDLAVPASASVEVFNIGGISLGSYASTQDAWNSLSSGTYILKYDNNQTVKIIIR